ncbi:hypothetical protein HMPREF0765_0498 [Sphingobacterium spiritivorum ATCC 33300]|uniref:Uncharacterized protein n=1 Tax=Sphingobacterium spiritivorum ATCC 33300 TaxID=525372 RepID=C2FT42_SPHSI|nr:hypothetical protein HMPREF0765_0498 [Sphingobacterium spiritivorum ATCC 33300]
MTENFVNYKKGAILKREGNRNYSLISTKHHKKNSRRLIIETLQPIKEVQLKHQKSCYSFYPEQICT